MIGRMSHQNPALQKNLQKLPDNKRTGWQRGIHFILILLQLSEILLKKRLL
jgi:hypothetical protein